MRLGGENIYIHSSSSSEATYERGLHDQVRSVAYSPKPERSTHCERPTETPNINVVGQHTNVEVTKIQKSGHQCNFLWEQYISHDIHSLARPHTCTIQRWDMVMLHRIFHGSSSREPHILSTAPTDSDSIYPHLRWMWFTLSHSHGSLSCPCTRMGGVIPHKDPEICTTRNRKWAWLKVDTNNHVYATFTRLLVKQDHVTSCPMEENK